MAVVIEVAGADGMPARPRIGDDGAADHARAVYLPDRDRAVGVLPQNVGKAVAVEVAGRLDVPARPRIADAPGDEHGRPIQLPNKPFPAAVLKQQTGVTTTIEVARRGRARRGAAGYAFWILCYERRDNLLRSSRGTVSDPKILHS